jgi:hypothetical protein
MWKKDRVMENSQQLQQTATYDHPPSDLVTIKPDLFCFWFI